MTIQDTTLSTQAFALRSTVAPAVLDDGAVLLDLVSKFFFQVNASGWAIVSLFESGVTGDEVARRCVEWGCVDRDEIERFIASLHEHDLLEAVTEPRDSSAAPIAGAWSTPTIERQEASLERVIMTAFDPSIALAE